jgi:hypothetical protein
MFKQSPSCSLNFRQTSSINCPNPQQSSHAGMYPVFTDGPDKSVCSGNYIDSMLTIPKITNQLTGDSIKTESTSFKGPKPLNLRPYAGFFSGPGMGSLNISDINTESVLRQGITESSPYQCTNINESSNYRFNCLPEYGNPQKVDHIIPPSVADGGWVRGGESTRNYVRRQRCGCP